MVRDPHAAAVVDGGPLELASGLLALVRPALDTLAPGDVLAVVSDAAGVGQDLAAWCRIAGHRYLRADRVSPGRERHLLVHGAGSLAGDMPGQAVPLETRPLTAAAMLAAWPMPLAADPSTGFAPRGAAVEPGGERFPFGILRRDQAGPPDAAALYDQATAGPWDPSRDIPWDQVPALEPAVESAVAQVMSFLAENELAALYVPARFLPRIHPAFVEAAMFLATQLADESRHIDAFLKRARLRGGSRVVSSAATARSLHGLLVPEDLTEAVFLLSVLGEGTFLDLLRFIEEHAPDPATAEVARRARVDEARHVHFGLAHVRHALAQDPTCASRLEGAVRRRAASLADLAEVPAAVQDALTILAAGSTTPVAVARGQEAYRHLLETMHEGRRRRLEHAGFSATQAEILSTLHTPNFM